MSILENPTPEDLRVTREIAYMAIEIGRDALRERDVRKYEVEELRGALEAATAGWRVEPPAGAPPSSST